MTARKLESSPAQPSDCTINARSPSSSLAGIVAQQQKQHKSKLAVPIKDNRPAAPVVATDINCSIRQDAWPKPMNATQTKASTSDQTLEEEKITQSDKNNNNNEDNNNTDKTRIDDDNNDAGDKCNKAASAPEKAELGPVQTEDSRRQIVQIASYTSQQQQQATLTSNQRQRPVQHHPNQHHSNPNQVQHQQHQPQQQIVPINLQTIVGPHHHQQSHFIQASPAAFPTARLVHHQQPLQVSWTCPVTDGSQVRDPQLYGALLHQHYPYATYHQQAASYPTIVQQQQPSTTTIASPTTGAAEFSPAPGPLGPMPAASYHPIPGPAFYTGHLYHQPQHQPVAVSLSHQHQHQLATLEQRAAAASRSGPQWQEVYGQLNDKLEPPPLVATRLADAADTGKVLGCNRLDKSTQHNDSSVDRRQLTSDTCGGGPIREHDEGATTPPPRNNSNGNSNNGTALDSGAILNRSPSQQQQQPRRLESSQDSATATTQSSGSSSLIVSADNEIKNDIITSEHNKRQPLNEPAIVASANAGFGNGNDDEDVGKHVKPSNQLEVALDRFKCQQSRAQGRPDSASVLAATTTTAADHLCQSSVDSQRINREEEENEEEDSCQQDCGIKISLIDTKDKPGGQKEGSNGLMVPVIKTSISESDQTINDTTNTSDICQALVVDVRVCPSGNKSHTGPGGVGGGEEGSIGIGNGNDQNQQEAIDLPPFGSVVAVVGPPSSKLSPCETQAGSADSKADEEAPQVAEAEGASTSTTSRARAAELNQISINGTTFYHVNPAIWRTLPATSTNGSSTTSPPPAPTLPPLPQPALISHHHHHQYMGYNQAAAYHHHQPMAFTTTQNGNSPPNIVPYFQPYHLHHHAQPPHQAPAAAAGGGHIVPIADYYYWPTTRHSTPLSAPYAFPFGLVHPAYSSPATQYYPHAADLGRNHQRPIATYHHGPAAGFRIYSNHHHHFSVPHDATSIALPVQVGTSSHHYGPLPSEPITTTAVIPSMAASVGMMQPDVHQLPATGATNTTATTITTTANTTATDVSQLKLGYNLIPLLPISAIPTRVRQAYGMDKVWQEEFEQLFAQFVSQVVWTLVEVETNPNIRNSSRILAYKGRYIVRVDGPPIGSDEVTVATAAADGSSGASMVSVQDGNQSEVDQHTSGEDEDDRDEGNDDDDNESSWTEEADDDDDDEQIRCSADDVEDNQTGNSGQGGRLGGSNCESDCDSGAVLNSTSSGSSSETASQDLSSHSELGANQESVTPTSPTPSPPLPQACQIISSAASNGAQQEPAIRHPSPAASSNAGSGGQDPSCPRSGIVGGGLGVDGRKFPLKFRMFIDSAKVRFCCDTCGHGWTSMKGRVVFWYELFELVDGPGHKNVEGVSNLIGYCAYKLFGQQCDICKIENRFERPMWYPEEVTKVLCNLFNKIGQVYFGLRMPTIDKQRRAGKPKTSHNSLLCQACHDGVCTDRK